jgi:hypothetical protein
MRSGRGAARSCRSAAERPPTTRSLARQTGGRGLGPMSARIGPPSRYTAQIASGICALAEGELLTDISAERGMPTRGTLYRWAERIPGFGSLFAYAREMQAHAVAEKGVKMAAAATAETSPADRLRFDAYKWFAAKLLPKVDGDKMLHTGADGEGPDAVWLAAMRAHEKRRRYYMGRLSAGRPAPRTMRELLNFPQFQADSVEATRLATADGFPDPSTVGDQPKVEGEVAEFLRDRCAESCGATIPQWRLVGGVRRVYRSGERQALRPAAARSGAGTVPPDWCNTLVIAKLDRLTRNLAFLANLMESGAEFVACDNPTATRFTIHILAAVAEQEGRAISQRTKDALAAAKARGTVLGGQRGNAPPDARLGAAAQRAHANAFAARVRPTIVALQAEAKSLRQIASELTAKGVKTAQGGAWVATTVRRVLARGQEQGLSRSAAMRPASGRREAAE